MDADVIIVGGGVMGLAAAWRLSVAGSHVLLLERSPIGHESGSSHGPTRLFRLAYDDPMYVRMARKARPLWDEADPTLLVDTGGIDIAARDALDGIADALTAGGATSEVLDPAARARRWPWLRAAPTHHALFSPDTAVIRAARAIARFAMLARDGGARLLDNTTVTAVDSEGDGVVVTAGQKRFTARRAILSAGPWMAPLSATAGIDLPLRVTREQVLYFAESEGLLPFIDRTDAFRYGVPSAGVAPGYKVAEHVAGVSTTADTRSFDLDPEAVERVGAYVRDALPGVASTPIASETCLYTLTPTEDFILDARGAIIVASPCSGHGFKFAPLIGEVLACLALDRTPPIPLERFRLPARSDTR